MPPSFSIQTVNTTFDVWTSSIRRQITVALRNFVIVNYIFKLTVDIV